MFLSRISSVTQLYPNRLLDNIKSEKSSLRKKASLCLGSFSLILSTKDVSSVADTLVDSITKNKGKKELLYFTIGLNAVVKNAAHKLPGAVKTIFPFIIKHIEEIIEDPGDNFEFTNELVDYYLSIIDYSIRLLPIETKAFISDVLHLITRLISYDPNYGGDDDGGLDIEDQEEDAYDDYEGYDDDDSSWKVRRAAVQVANTLIMTHPELLRKLAEGVFDKLVRRFKEKEQNVKLEVFNALSNFLRMMIYGEGKEVDEIDNDLELPALTRSKSILAENSNKITSMISNLIKVFKDKKSNANLKIAASVLLSRAAKFTSDAVIEKIDEALPLIASEYAVKENSNELKVNMLKSLRFLLKSQASKRENRLEKKYADIVKLIASAIKNEYFKISSEGFKVLSLLYKALRPETSSPSNGFKDYIKGIFSNIIDKLKENDIDQEVKTLRPNITL
jgi:cullin-associated NEDD8-dissociated protein 1